MTDSDKTPALESLREEKKKRMMRKDWAGVVEIIDKILLQEPSVDLVSQKGLMLLQQARYNDAIDCFSKVLARAPEFTQAREGLAKARALMDKKTQANLEQIQRQPHHHQATDKSDSQSEPAALAEASPQDATITEADGAGTVVISDTDKQKAHDMTTTERTVFITDQQTREGGLLTTDTDKTAIAAESGAMTVQIPGTGNFPGEQTVDDATPVSNGIGETPQPLQADSHPKEQHATWRKTGQQEALLPPPTQDASLGQVLAEEKQNLEKLFGDKQKAEDKAQQFGRYQIVAELGRGGMGKVYRVYDPQLKREGALKTMLAGTDPQQVKRFLKEAEAMARLSHPNIVKVYDIGNLHNTYYFTMELIKGKNLSQLIRDGKMTVRRAVEIAKKVALAIDYAHKEGILHRDIKPSNIMMENNSEPKIMDFGLALERESDTRLSKSGAVIGTPAYMPPEQAEGKRKEIDERSDVYSLGAVLYELLTETAPFHGSNTHVIINQVLNKDPIAPSRISKTVPKDVEKICLKAMAKEKRLRYQSAHEMALDLERFLNGEPVVAMELGAGYRLKKWVKKNRVLTMSSILFLVLLAVAGIIFIGQKKQQQEDKAKVQLAEKKVLEAEKKALEEERKTRRVREEEQRKTVESLVSSYFEQADWLCAAGYLQKACLLLAQALYIGEREEASAKLLRRMQLRLAYRFPELSSRWEVWEENAHLEALAFRPDGKQIVMLRRTDGKVKIYDLATRQAEVLYQVNDTNFLALSFHPQGNLLALGADDSTIHLVDMTTRQLRRCFRAGHSESVTSVSFSQDGKLLASASRDGHICIWDVEKDEPQASLIGHLDRVYAVAFSPNQNLVASGGADQSVILWEMQDNKWSRKVLRGHAGGIMCVAFSPNGKILASGGEEGDIRLWDVSSKNLRNILKGHSLEVNALAFSPDGNTLVSASDDTTVRLWDMHTENIREILQGHQANAEGVAFCPDGKLIASAGRDSTMRIWKLKQAKLHAKLCVPRGGWHDVTAMTFSPDGTQLFSGGSEEVLRVWSVADGALRNIKSNGLGRITGLAFVNDGKRLLITTNHGNIGYLKMAGDGFLSIKQNPRNISSMALTPDKKSAFLGGEKLRIWDITGETMRATAHMHSDRLLASLSCDPYSKILAIGNFGQLVLWRTNDSGDKLQPLHAFKDLPSVMASLDFQPTRGKILAAGCYDGNVYLWNMEKVIDDPKKASPTRLRRHLSRVNTVAFQPDGEILASGSLDQTVCLWDMESASLCTVFNPNIGGIAVITFSPDGKLLACGNNNAIVLWRIQKDTTLESLPPKQLQQKMEMATGFALDDELNLSPITAKVLSTD